MIVICQEQAESILSKCKEQYNSDKFHFDMNLSMFFAGDHNKGLRQDIIEFLTGKRPPATKAGIHALADLLKQRFEQFTLF
jgi:hypothetical protein